MRPSEKLTGRSWGTNQVRAEFSEAVKEVAKLTSSLLHLHRAHEPSSPRSQVRRRLEVDPPQGPRVHVRYHPPPLEKTLR